MGLPKKRGPKPSFSDARIAEALAKNAGIYRATARALKCDRHTIERRVKASPTLQIAAREAVENITDIAEGNVFKGILDNDKTYTLFFLKCRAKARGWVERSEVTGADGGPITWTDLTRLAAEAET